MLFLKFSDNGIGFSKKSKKGLGLNNIKQRSKLLEGNIIFNTSDKGTTILLEVPIKPNLNEE
jgi:signal transduction histidine kinase